MKIHFLFLPHILVVTAAYLYFLNLHLYYENNPNVWVSYKYCIALNIMEFTGREKPLEVLKHLPPHQNYPNPHNPAAKIRLMLSAAGNVPFGLMMYLTGKSLHLRIIVCQYGNHKYSGMPKTLFMSA